MSLAKLRAAIVVFLIGFALGVSVFAASRLVVRSVLSADAVATAEELAARLAGGESVEATGTLSHVVRYTWLDAKGEVVESRSLAVESAPQPAMSQADMTRIAELTAEAGPVVDQAPLLSSLLGLSESGVRGVAAPVAADGRRLGTVFVEVDQANALASLSQAFTVAGMMTVGLAVLAVIAIAFAVTRGRGFAPERKMFDPATLPRDPLTDAPTRRGFREALAHAVEEAREADKQVGLLVVDLDRFRGVNDIWGHAVGDDVVRLVAERLRAFAPGAGNLARIAGDEFALIVSDDDTHSMRRLAAKIQVALGAPFDVAGSAITIGASIGAALYPVNADSAEILFRAADTALSKAKAKGRNALAFFDTEMRERMQRSAALERDLRLAFEREEFVVFYQPQLELASGRLRGYEALVRWERPGEGILSPRDFLAVAEETGLIRPLGEWVLRKACADAASWLDAGTVGVNFSAAQFVGSDADRMIARILAETGLAPERLEIEVHESLFLDHSPDIMEVLSRIKALGVRVAMDDFGSGYSGLASLADFPFDKIKIDRRFVAQLTEDADVAAIVSAIVALGRSLSVDITAEGVETSEQVTLLKAAGCSIVQGFLFGAPKRKASSEESQTVAPPIAVGSGR
jgi:diguanylate cyclase (GGDEF)-like protein